MTIANVIMLLASVALASVTVFVYERILEQVRNERDEAIADADLFSQLMLDDLRADAVNRHPSQRNLRVVR